MRFHYGYLTTKGTKFTKTGMRLKMTFFFLPGFPFASFVLFVVSNSGGWISLIGVAISID